MSDIKVIADRDEIVAIADAVRNKTGTTGEMTLSGIATGVNSITPTIHWLNVTSNGTYTAPAGVDGYSPVTVNVASSGGSTTMYSGTITTMYTTYMLYYSNGSTIQQVELTSSTSISVPAHSIVVLYSPWGDTTVGSVSNANTIMTTYTCDCGETVGIFEVTGDSFIIEMY